MNGSVDPWQRVAGVRPRKNNNQSNDRQVNEPGNYAVAAVPVLRFGRARWDEDNRSLLPPLIHLRRPPPAIPLLS